MSVISKKFADELADDKEMRDAYLEEQTRTKLAQQIRELRMQRDLSQSQVGALMHKPQSNIRRLENRDVGRYTLSTLLEVASAFDVALVAKFVPYDEFLRDTSDLDPEKLTVKSFSKDTLAQLCEDAPHTAVEAVSEIDVHHHEPPYKVKFYEQAVERATGNYGVWVDASTISLQNYNPYVVLPTSPSVLTLDDALASWGDHSTIINTVARGSSFISIALTQNRDQEVARLRRENETLRAERDTAREELAASRPEEDRPELEELPPAFMLARPHGAV